MSLLNKVWNKNKGRKRQSFPEGKKIMCHVAKMTKKTDDDENETVSIQLITVGGPDSEGAEIPAKKSGFLRYQCYDRSGTGPNGDWERSGEEDVQRMMEDFALMGYNTKEYSFSDIMDDINGDEEELFVYVNASKGKNSDYINIYLQGAVPDDELPEDDEEEEYEEDDEDEEEEDDDVEETDEEEEYEDEDGGEEDEEEEEEYEDEEDEEEEEDFEPIKGMKVMAKPAKCRNFAEYKVTSVKKSTKVCILKRIKDEKVYKEVPFSAIEGEVEE